ncbi:MAG: YDG domain-containing protein [Bacteroidales bacterium]
MADKTEVCISGTVTFSDQSSGATSWEWNFGEGADPATASGVGPHEVIFTAGGSKTVILTVNDTLTETKIDYITVYSLPEPPTAENESFIYDGQEHTASATVAEDHDIIWYDNSTGGSITSQPAGTNAGTYTAWAEAVNNVTGCASATRTEVTLTVEQKNLTITAEDKTKTYGELIEFDISAPSADFYVGGLVNDDQVTGITLASDGAAEAATVSLSPYNIVPGAATGPGLDNYSISYVNGALTVEQKNLTITGSFTAFDKLFDGTTDAETDENNLIPEGLENGDDVTLTDVVIQFADAAAGEDIQVTIVSAGTKGADAGNYSLSLIGAPVTEASITMSPVITNVVYNASTGSLSIVGNHLRTDEEIDVTRLTVSRGDDSYTFTDKSINTIPSSGTQANIMVKGFERAVMNWIFDNDESVSLDGESYNIAAATNWNGMSFEDPASPVFVVLYQAPSIVEATYNRVSGNLVVTASGLAAKPGTEKDIDATKFTVTGKGNESHTLSFSPDVKVSSDTMFVIPVKEGDKEQVDLLLDIEGLSSSQGDEYNLGAADGWNIPVHPAYNTEDLENNPVTATEINNLPPVVSNVIIAGEPGIGITVEGDYDYDDLENDSEGNSLFNWYRATDASGSDSAVIEGETEKTYTLTLDDAGKYISFEVTPVAVSGDPEGEPVKSSWTGVVNEPPSVSDVVINGILEVCRELTAQYEYFDQEQDMENGTKIRWLRADDNNGSNAEQISEGISYIPAPEDEGKYIRIEVTPVASTGASPGDTERSDYYGPVINALPTVSISGPAGFCQGSEADITFSFTGKAPWTVNYTDGNDEIRFTTSDNPYILTVETGGNYRVVSLTDAIGCEGTDLGNTLDLTTIPTIRLSDNWYTENFENGRGEWTSATPSGDMPDSWIFGPPSGEIFTSASSGQNIWYTDVTDSDTEEQSWITGPCFDFTDIERPMIAIDLWKEFETESDGAVLQFSDNNARSWHNIGEPGSGINWYSSSQITGRPGGQGTGWTASEADENGWQESRHALDNLINKEHVRLRLAFGREGSGKSIGGVAFDNVRIKERERLVLLEHFTNATDNKSLEANNTVHNIALNNPYDIIHINYHTSFPSSDPINEMNVADPAARAFYYGITSPPYSVMDGGSEGTGNYDYSASEITSRDVILRSLISPLFTISIDPAMNGDELNIQADVTSLVDLDSPDMTLHLAVIDTEITASEAGLQGNHVYRNVVKKLLPDAGGTRLNAVWEQNQTETYNFNWTIENIIDTQNLAIVMFIQDEMTRHILQAASSAQFDIPTSTNQTATADIDSEIIFYPNPVTENLYIRFKNPVTELLIIEAYNISGSLIFSDTVPEGASIIEFNANNIPKGAYIFQIKNNKGVKISEKIMIIS